MHFTILNPNKIFRKITDFLQKRIQDTISIRYLSSIELIFGFI